MEAGSNFLSGCEPEAILRGVATVINSQNNWVAPRDYLTQNVSDVVTRIVLSYYRG